MPKKLKLTISGQTDQGTGRTSYSLTVTNEEGNFATTSATAAGEQASTCKTLGEGPFTLTRDSQNFAIMEASNVDMIGSSPCCNPIIVNLQFTGADAPLSGDYDAETGPGVCD